MTSRILDVIGLYRLHTALVTAAVPGIAGYIAGGSPFLILSVIAGTVLHHAWAFSLNEIMDLDIDRRNAGLSHKPLVSGRLSVKRGWVLSCGSLLFSFVIFAAGALVSGGSLAAVMTYLLLATIFGGIYDVFGKRFPLSDLFVALWMFFLVMAGAGAVSGPGPYPLAVWAAASLSFLHILFNNSVEGGLKDVENDRTSDVRSLAIFTGARFRGNHFEIPLSFRSWGMFLRASFIITASVLVVYLAEEADMGNWIMVVVPAAGLLLFAHSMTFLSRRVDKDRTSLIRTFAVHELISFGLCILVVLPAMGPIAALIAFFLPMAWVLFFNRLVYRTGLAPKV